MTDLIRRVLLAEGCAALASGCAVHSLPPAPAPTRPITSVTRAEHFADGALKGFMIGGVERDPQLLDEAAGLGANLVRLVYPFDAPDATPGARAAAATAMRVWLQRAQQLGLRVVVTASTDGSRTAPLWRDEERRKAFIEQWHGFARRFADAPALAGLDLLNEPDPPRRNHRIEDAHDAWLPLAMQTVLAIRSLGIDLPMIVEPVLGGSTWGLRGMQPLADPQIVYSIHFYTPHDITHQRVAPAWPRRIPYPAGPQYRLGSGDAELGITAWDIQRLEAELERARAFQQQHRCQMYVGEFSCVRWAPDHSALRWIMDCLHLFAKHSWSWTYHEFRGWPGWDAEIDSEDPQASRRSVDAPVMKVLRQAFERTPR